MPKNRLENRYGKRLDAHKRSLTSVQRLFAVQKDLGDQRVYRSADNQIHPDHVVFSIPETLQNAECRRIDSIEVLKLVDEHGHRLRPGSLEHLAEKTTKRPDLARNGIRQYAVEFLDEIRHKICLALPRHEEIHKIPVSKCALYKLRLANASASGDDSKLRLRETLFTNLPQCGDLVFPVEKLHSGFFLR